MKSTPKTLLCLCLALILLSTTFVVKASDEPITILEYDGYFESAYIKWQALDDIDSYNVYIKAAGGDFEQLDRELVRTYPSFMRADAVGLKAGEYIFKIVPVKNGTELENLCGTTANISVMPHTREGFGFSQNSPCLTSSGAYNDDGTLKSNADVIYITNGNKDTVTINNDTSLGVGLTEILAHRQSKKINTPLSIRLIGKIDEPKDIVIHTAQFQNTGNITLEGIGDDATIFGWIMTLKRVKNMEIRNLATMYGGEGTTGSAIVLDTDNKNIWVHNCDFFYGAPGKDADQKKGDGAVDLKSRSSFVTLDYNHFWDLGKTCVSGGPWENSNMYSDEAQIYVTYHHNWFDHTDSRHPRCVVGSNHVYNNYYDGNAMYGIGAAMKTSVFSEANYYRNCPRPMIIASQGGDMWNGKDYTGGDNKKGTLSGQMGGMIKSYGDKIITPKHFYAYGDEPVTGEFDAYVATERDEVVPNTVTAKLGDENGKGIYNNFDTNPDIMYPYSADTAEVAMEKVKKYAGRIGGGDFKWTFNNATDDSFHDIDENLLAAIKSYTSSLVAVANGDISIIPPIVTPTETPTADPNATPKPTQRPDGKLTKMPVGAKSYAKDWFDGAAMSAGDTSYDGYVKCFKGTGNSYKTNTFTFGDVTATRGYQTKAVDQRSYYIIPEQECDVTVYFYTNGTNSLGIYTTSLDNAAAVFTPQNGGGNYAFTYHFTEVGSPLYIAGPMGDINLSGISLSKSESSENFDYEIENAAYDQSGKLSVTLKYNGTGQDKNAKLIIAEYTNDSEQTLICAKIIDIDGETYEYNKTAIDSTTKLFVWANDGSVMPLSIAQYAK